LKYKSYAVAAQRHTSKQGADLFPTPPWATRAFIETLPYPKDFISQWSCLEPACGPGYMARSLSEYFLSVSAYDKFDYGQDTPPTDFLTGEFEPHDRVISNPPFNLAKEFIEKSLTIANVGVAMLARTVFIEGQKRFMDIYRDNPPAYFMPYVERVPMLKDRLDRKASTATSYAWFVWTKEKTNATQVLWIPPSRKRLERDSDYAQ
jgi:hypothetical protein